MIVCCLYALIPAAKSVFVRDQIAFAAITDADAEAPRVIAFECRYVVRPRACFNLISFCTYNFFFRGNYQMPTCVPT